MDPSSESKDLTVGNSINDRTKDPIGQDGGLAPGDEHPFHFFRLPPEIRDMVYHSAAHDTPDGFRFSVLTLTLVSKRMRAEVTPVFFNDVRLSLWLGMTCVLGTVDQPLAVSFFCAALVENEEDDEDDHEDADLGDADSDLGEAHVDLEEEDPDLQEEDPDLEQEHSYFGIMRIFKFNDRSSGGQMSTSPATRFHELLTNVSLTNELSGYRRSSVSLLGATENAFMTFKHTSFRGREDFMKLFDRLGEAFSQRLELLTSPCQIQELSYELLLSLLQDFDAVAAGPLIAAAEEWDISDRDGIDSIW